MEHIQTVLAHDKQLFRGTGVVKITAFDVFLTAAALAALIFLLPGDRDTFKPDSQKHQINVSLLK